MQKVHICLGRFQPFTIGHLMLAMHDVKDGLKTVILAVSTPDYKTDIKHPFGNALMKKEFDIIKQKYQDYIQDVLYVKSADIVKWGELIKEHGYQAAVWLTGSDEYKFYDRMAKNAKSYEQRFPECRGAFTEGFYVEEVRRSESSDSFIESVSGTKVRNALKENDYALFKKMMPDGTEILFDDFKAAMMKFVKEGKKCLKDYLAESAENVNEGGNAVECDPVPAYLSMDIADEIIKKIHSYYPSLDIAVLGSVGKKADSEYNGDIDLAVNIDSYKKLQEVVLEVFGSSIETSKTTSTIFSIGYPWSMKGKEGTAQVDFMMVKDMEWAKFCFHSPDLKMGESKYKGVIAKLILSAAISALPVSGKEDEYYPDGSLKKHWKYTYNNEGIYKQLLDYEGKLRRLKSPKRPKEYQEFVTSRPEEVKKLLFREDVDINDLLIAERLWKIIHSSKFLYPEIVPQIEDAFFNDIAPKYGINIQDFLKNAR